MAASTAGRYSARLLAGLSASRCAVPVRFRCNSSRIIDPELHQRRTPRTIPQKWRQIRLALALERQWSKAEILEAYLNLVSYRGELQGIAAAASVLFGKAPHGITDTEAAILAVLLRGPNAEPAIVARRVRALLQTHGGAATPAGHHGIGGAGGRCSRGHGAQSLSGAACGATIVTHDRRTTLRAFDARRPLASVRCRHAPPPPFGDTSPARL